MSDRPRQIAHVNLNALNFDASHRFFTETLGFRLIDENAPLWFLHCDTSEHSSIVLAKTGLATLNHIAFEMPDFDSVMRGMGTQPRSARYYRVQRLFGFTDDGYRLEAS